VDNIQRAEFRKAKIHINPGLCVLVASQHPVCQRSLLHFDIEMDKTSWSCSKIEMLKIFFIYTYFLTDKAMNTFEQELNIIKLRNINQNLKL